MPNDMGEILKQAQALQSKIAELQAAAQSKTAEASVGGGMVTAVVNGKLELVSIRIEPQVFEAGDREMLQDLVIAAVNEAIRKVQQLMAEEMSKATGGLKIPGLLG
jgi:DNA-binding YbaB/EbfC family protein